MKIAPSIRRLLNFAIIPGTALLLAAAGINFACAQNTTTTAPATVSATDVSQFPTLDQLPGKVPLHVWNGLANVWARDHARWAATATNDAGAVVFLGDSITEGWRTLATDFPNLKVANRGIGGDITSGVLYRLKADVLAKISGFCFGIQVQIRPIRFGVIPLRDRVNYSSPVTSAL
jgi:hypothetical protein